MTENARSSHFVVFTDLDGTLLEERTYSFEAAHPALARLKELGCPLVFCTSKTFAECRTLQRRMGVEGALIVENGGCVYLPPNLVASSDPREHSSWKRIPLGVPYSELRRHLSEVREEIGLNILGMGDAGPEFLKMHCNLAHEDALEAMQREFDEPFLLQTSEVSAIGRMFKAFADRGLQVSQGGRFYHLSGNSDKGRAVKLLTSLLREAGLACQTAGLGDSPNDIPMLAAVQQPFLVMRPGGFHDPTVIKALFGIRLIPLEGPRGWNQAINELLSGADPGLFRGHMPDPKA